MLTVLTRPWEADWGLLGGQVVMNGHSLPALLPAAWMVLVATVLAYLTGVVSVRHLSPPVAGVVANLEAVVATVLAWILLGEHLGLPQTAGGLLVLAGAFAAQASKPSPAAAPVEVAAPTDDLTGATALGERPARTAGAPDDGERGTAVVSGRPSRTSRGG